MTASTRLPDDSPIARAAVRDNEDATDALLRAARRAHMDLDEVDSLHGRIDAGALDALVAHHRRRDTDGEFILVVDLWGHTFVVRPDAVEVYP